MAETIDRDHVCIVPKGEAAGCADCEAIFSIRCRTCPACGSEQVYLMTVVKLVAQRSCFTLDLPVKGEVS